MDATYFYCHECKRWQDCERPNEDDPYYWCNECGHRIQCDECGQEWTDDHACGAGS